MELIQTACRRTPEGSRLRQPASLEATIPTRSIPFTVVGAVHTPVYNSAVGRICNPAGRIANPAYKKAVRHPTGNRSGHSLLRSLKPDSRCACLLVAEP